MSEQNPYQQLGVTEDSSFEEIQAAKTRLSTEYQNDAKRLEMIETAYDAVIMDRLKMRQEGRIKVPDRIRFPERSIPSSPSPSAIKTPKSPEWLQGFLDQPSQAEWLWPSGIFGGLTLLSVFSQGGASNLALWLALGTVANLYFLNRKENKFSRAFLITLVGLIVGIAGGTFLARFLIPSLDETQVACVATLVIFWLSSCFLR